MKRMPTVVNLSCIDQKNSEVNQHQLQHQQIVIWCRQIDIQNWAKQMIRGSFDWWESLYFNVWFNVNICTQRQHHHIPDICYFFYTGSIFVCYFWARIYLSVLFFTLFPSLHFWIPNFTPKNVLQTPQNAKKCPWKVKHCQRHNGPRVQSLLLELELELSFWPYKICIHFR